MPILNRFLPYLRIIPEQARQVLSPPKTRMRKTRKFKILTNGAGK
jgi:hypothetical protein